MVYQGTTIDHLKEHGVATISIIAKKKGNDLIDVFLEDEKENKRQIAEDVDFVDIEGITKDNNVYHITMVAEGELYIADYVLYRESTEEELRTLTILIPLY